jgi:hypothetical protein
MGEFECLYRCECGEEFMAVCRPNQVDLTHICAVPELSVGSYCREALSPVASLAHIRRGVARPVIMAGRTFADGWHADAPYSRDVAPVRRPTPDPPFRYHRPSYEGFSPDQLAIDARSNLCWRCDSGSAGTDVGLCQPCLDVLRQEDE